jgi:hypothetical protein
MSDNVAEIGCTAASGVFLVVVSLIIGIFITLWGEVEALFIGWGMADGILSALTSMIASAVIAVVSTKIILVVFFILLGLIGVGGASAAAVLGYFGVGD